MHSSMHLPSWSPSSPSWSNPARLDQWWKTRSGQPRLLGLFCVSCIMKSRWCLNMPNSLIGSCCKDVCCHNASAPLFLPPRHHVGQSRFSSKSLGGYWSRTLVTKHPENSGGVESCFPCFPCFPLIWIGYISPHCCLVLKILMQAWTWKFSESTSIQAVFFRFLGRKHIKVISEPALKCIDSENLSLPSCSSLSILADATRL